MRECLERLAVSLRETTIYIYSRPLSLVYDFQLSTVQLAPTAAHWGAGL